MKYNSIFSKLKNNLILSVSVVTIVASSVYWLFLASDRYVTTSHVVLHSSQIQMPDMNISSFMGGKTNSSEQLLLLRDYLLSVDVLLKLDKSLGFGRHFTSSKIDYFSRFNGDLQEYEELQDYYHDVVTIEMDEYAGVLKIRVEAFTPEMSLRMSKFLLKEGESKMNDLSRELAKEKLLYAKSDVKQSYENLKASQNKLIAYENSKGIALPKGELEQKMELIAELNLALSNLLTKKESLKGFRTNNSFEIKSVNNEIRSIKSQINKHQSNLTKTSSNESGLNTVNSEHQALLSEIEWAKGIYASSLTMYETLKSETVRNVKKLSVIQSPRLPLVSSEPNRVYNAILSITLIFLFSFIVSFFLSVIKER